MHGTIFKYELFTKMSQKAATQDILYRNIHCSVSTAFGLYLFYKPPRTFMSVIGDDRYRCQETHIIEEDTGYNILSY